MTRKRYVEIPADRLVAELERIGGTVAAIGGSWSWSIAGRERVFDLCPTTPAGDRSLPAQIRIFTSLAVGDSHARACGKDAIRIVVGALSWEREVYNCGERGERRRPGRVESTFRPVEKGQKILRTARRDAEDRVGVFLSRLRVALRDAYLRARVVRTCVECDGLMAHRKGRNGAFLGCINYPKCHHTEQVRS